MNSVRPDSSVWRLQTKLSKAPGRAETFANGKDALPTSRSRAAKELIRCAIEDDDDKARFLLKKILERAGEYRCVVSYASGEEAMYEVPRVRPEIVFVEIRLPGMSGIDYMRRLKMMLPGLAVVLVSRLKKLEIMAEALAAGGDGYLTKPFSVVQCLANLTIALRRSGAGASHNAEVDASPGRAHECVQLTKRQNEVMRCFAKGLYYKEIASELGISYSAVHRHQEKIFRRLHVSNRTEALNKWRESMHV